MEQNTKKYRTYSVQDFVLDDDFRSWVLKPTAQADAFWNAWLLQHPQQGEKLQAGREIILALQLKEEKIPDPEISQAIAAILNQCSSENLGPAGNPSWPEVAGESGFSPAKNKMLTSVPLLILKIAALFIFIIGAGVFFYSHHHPSSLQEVASGYGSLKQVVLPDSSVIVLNGNSKISFPKNWKENERREVWLEGEAFFRIRHLDRDQHIKDHERFLVHFKNATVEVLGTSFDIRERRNKTQIVLQSGRIRLSFADNRTALIMEPGQMVTIDPATAQPVGITRIQPENYSAWTEKKLLLRNAPLGEILQYIEDNYGKEIILQDPSLLQHQYQGTIMLDNLDDALFVLSKVLNVTVLKKENKIYFMTK